MSYILRVAAVAAAFLLPCVSMAADTAPEGLWLTEEGKAVVQVEKCDQGLCGSFYWLKDQTKIYDDENPDPALQRRALCGLKILYGFTQSTENPNLWEDGQVYKADDGDLYDGYIKVINNDEMYLRGFIGISLLGKSQTWVRASSSDYPQCKDPGLKPVSDAPKAAPEKQKQNWSTHQ